MPIIQLGGKNFTYDASTDELGTFSFHFFFFEKFLTNNFLSCLVKYKHFFVISLFIDNWESEKAFRRIFHWKVHFFHEHN